MAFWLLKTEPSDYSFADLVKDGKTVWSGVKNATALKHIRAIKKGDRVFIYHTGAQRAIVGSATVSSDPYADPDDGETAGVVFELKPLKPIQPPVTLEQIKADAHFAGWDLLRIGRLSVVPTTSEQWDQVHALSAD